MTIDTLPKTGIKTGIHRFPPLLLREAYPAFHFVAAKLAAMATLRLCCSSSSSSLLLPRASSSHSHRPAASSFVRLPSLSNGIHRFGGRTTTPLHIAHAKIAKGPERKGLTTSAPEPEMTPEEKKAYDDVSASLEGVNTDFWEGPQFNALGFAVQYLWVFGIVVSVSELRKSIPS